MRALCALAGHLLAAGRSVQRPPVPGRPFWVLWMLWGALIGALACGFWTIAPVFGLRKQRSFTSSAGPAPFVLMALMGLVRMVLAHK